jgi:hypothetical protein
MFHTDDQKGKNSTTQLNRSIPKAFFNPSFSVLAARQKTDQDRHQLFFLANFVFARA